MFYEGQRNTCIAKEQKNLGVHTSYHIQTKDKMVVKYLKGNLLFKALFTIFDVHNGRYT